MVAVRALERRIAKLELASKPRPSPITIMYGSIDAWVERYIIPDIQAGRVCPREMADLVAAMRSWEERGYYDN